MNAHTQARKHASTQARGRGVGEVGGEDGCGCFHRGPFCKECQKQCKNEFQCTLPKRNGTENTFQGINGLEPEGVLCDAIEFDREKS